MRNAVLILGAILTLAAVSGCAGVQQQQAKLDIRPLGETQAFEVIEVILAERGYTWERDVNVGLSGNMIFKCDYRVKDMEIAIEFLTEQDKLTMGNIPPPAAGSRLHVLRAYSVDDVASELNAPPSTLAARAGKEPLYVFFIDDTNFRYHFNPTSENRADVTLPDVQARLRRDLADYISWYENLVAPQG
jgi:hypothetical protein